MVQLAKRGLLVNQIYALDIKYTVTLVDIHFDLMSILASGLCINLILVIVQDVKLRTNVMYFNVTHRPEEAMYVQLSGCSLVS